MRLALMLIIIFLSPLIFNQALSAQERLPSKNYDLHISKGIIEWGYALDSGIYQM